METIPGCSRVSIEELQREPKQWRIFVGVSLRRVEFVCRHTPNPKPPTDGDSLPAVD
jgi:hypothetical protein